MRTLLTTVIVLLLSTTAANAQLNCRGDCNGDNRVTVNELLIGVQILLGEYPPSRCRGCSFGCGSNPATIGELVAAVGYALDGCGCPEGLLTGGRESVCVFRGDLSSLDCPPDIVAVSFRSEQGSVRDPRTIFRVESPAVSFLWKGHEDGLRFWSAGTFVNERSNSMRGTALIETGGKRLTLTRTSGNVLINGCRFDRFEGIYVGIR